MPRRKKEVQPQEIIKVMKTPSIVPGMKDVLPGDEKYWDVIENETKRAIRDYSYKRIRVPIIEKNELFNHTLFKQSGLADRELFNFVDKGEKIALRPGATVSVARAYLQHNMDNQPMPLKLFYWGPMFRQGKVSPVKLRQFAQVGFEILGDDSAAIDAELIVMAYYLLKNLKLDSEVKLNSLGCVSCRPEYQKALGGFIKSKRTAVCADCRKNATKDPMKFLSCDSPKCVRTREDAPQTVDWLCDDCRNHLFKVLEYLDELKVPYKLDSGLVRTFGYYTKTIFEVISPTEKEGDAGVVLAAGGRYDNLVTMIGGPEPTPGVGISLGFESVINHMKRRRVELPKVVGPDVFVAQIGELARQKSFSFFEALRTEGFSVKSNFSKSSLKDQLDLALKVQAKIILILGQKEIMEGTIILRDVESGIQEVINISKVIVEVKKKLKDKKKRNLTK